MSGTSFLAGLAQGAAGEYMSREERKREEEKQNKQMTVGLLGSLLHDENLSPDEHTHVVKMLFSSAGLKGKDADQILNSYSSFGDLIRSWSQGGQSSQPSTPRFTPNRITLDRTQGEPPATSRLVPGGSLSLGTLGGQPEPMVTALPTPAPQTKIPDVPGAQPGFAAGLNDSIQQATNGGQSPSGNRPPTAEELQSIGNAGSSSPFSLLKRPDNYDSLPPRLQRIVDRKIKEQQDTYGSEMGEMGDRLRLMGGTYRQGADKRLDELVQRYGASPKRPSAGGFNPQKIRTVGNEVVYIEDPSVPPIVLHRAGMTDADKQRNAIALANVNAFRYRNGEEPLMFAADLPTLPGSPSASSIPDVPGAAPTSTSPVSPTTLVPVPGAKIPAVPVYRGYRPRARAGGQSTGQSKSEQIAETTSLSAIRDVARLRTESASARMRGEVDAANEADAAADAIVDSTLKARKENVETVMGASGKRILRLKGSGTDVPTATNAPQSARGLGTQAISSGLGAAGTPRQYTEAEIRKNAKENNLDPDEAVRFARQNGRLKRGN